MVRNGITMLGADSRASVAAAGPPPHCMGQHAAAPPPHLLERLQHKPTLCMRTYSGEDGEMLTEFTVLVALLASPPVTTSSDSRCSIVVSDDDERLSPVQSLQRTVRAADAIVRVRATALADSVSGPATFGPRTRISFDVLDVLRGDSVPASLAIVGRLVNHDEFNSGEVPYTAPRRTALSGACFSYNYRVGAEYALLLVREDDGELTPYWAALQPVNEQVTGADDPWIRWLRGELSR
jgi:hypothetical protein